MEIIKIDNIYSVSDYLINEEEYDIGIDSISEIMYDPYIKSLFIVTNNEIVKMLDFDYNNYLLFIRKRKIQNVR